MDYFRVADSITINTNNVHKSVRQFDEICRKARKSWGLKEKGEKK